MGQTPAGAIKARQSMIERYGSEESYKEHLRTIGGKGGKRSSGGGFAHPNSDPSAAGRKGGLISKRRPKEKN